MYWPKPVHILVKTGILLQTATKQHTPCSASLCVYFCIQLHTALKYCYPSAGSSPKTSNTWEEKIEHFKNFQGDLGGHIYWLRLPNTDILEKSGTLVVCMCIYWYILVQTHILCLEQTVSRRFPQDYRGSADLHQVSAGFVKRPEYFQHAVYMLHSGQGKHGSCIMAYPTLLINQPQQYCINLRYSISNSQPNFQWCDKRRSSDLAQFKSSLFLINWLTVHAYLRIRSTLAIYEFRHLLVQFSDQAFLKIKGQRRCYN